MTQRSLQLGSSTPGTKHVPEHCHGDGHTAGHQPGGGHGPMASLSLARWDVLCQCGHAGISLHSGKTAYFFVSPTLKTTLHLGALTGVTF